MLRKLRALLRLLKGKITPYMGLCGRIIFCFAIGLLIYAATSGTYFDSRFSVRGPQNVSSDITIITVSRDDIISASELADHNTKNMLRSLKELGDVSDAFYWNLSLWERALQKINSAKPKAIVVTVFLGKEVPPVLTKQSNIFWAVKNQEETLNNIPNVPTDQVGPLNLFPDPDGNIRHFFGGAESLAYKVAAFYGGHPISNFNYGQPINFQGPRGTFKTFTFADLVKGLIKPIHLQNKTVILTTSDMTNHMLPTPVGYLSTGEATANVIYNYIHDLWIKEIPWFLATLYLAAILMTTLWIIFSYPESVALVFLGFLTVFIFVLSAALFDLKAVWLPLESPLALIIFTYVVVTGYRLSASEKHSWQAEQELHYLGEVESLKNNFLSLISHDLKNPLAKIQAITDRLLSSREPNASGEFKEDLTTIRRTSDELRQYITSILQLTRVEARDIKLKREVCDINNIVADVLEKLKPLAESKNIKIATDLEPLFSMEADRSLITEVLINLVENAIKYSDISAMIEIKTSELNNMVRVEVVDHAGGILEAELPKIFDKFYRGSGDKTIQVTGTGLGLYLVKYFIELHGGSVFINSQPGKGTQIGFLLPIESSEEENYATEFARSHR